MEWILNDWKLYSLLSVRVVPWISCIHSTDSAIHITAGFTPLPQPTWRSFASSWYPSTTGRMVGWRGRWRKVYESLWLISSPTQGTTRCLSLNFNTRFLVYRVTWMMVVMMVMDMTVCLWTTRNQGGCSVIRDAAITRRKSRWAKISLVVVAGVIAATPSPWNSAATDGRVSCVRGWHLCSTRSTFDSTPRVFVCTVWWFTSVWWRLPAGRWIRWSVVWWRCPDARAVLI